MTKITLNMEVTDFHEFVTHVKRTKTEMGHDCVMCKRTHEYLKRVARREMKKAGWS